MLSDDILECEYGQPWSIGGMVMIHKLRSKQTNDWKEDKPVECACWMLVGLLLGWRWQWRWQWALVLLVLTFEETKVGCWRS